MDTLKQGDEVMKVLTLINVVLVALLPLSALAAPMPKDIETQVREVYSKKYPDNFSMQKTLIDDQKDSYEFLDQQEVPEEMDEELYKKLREIYLEKYPLNFSMQKVLVQDQIESYFFVESYQPDSVPEDLVEKLKKKYQGRYPYNFSMQKVLLEDQVKSYLELAG